MKVYMSAERSSSAPQQVFEVCMWLANISAALFIGEGGDVRVGSGGHPWQKVFIQRYNSSNILSIYAKPYDTTTRVYLGMDYKGGLETVVASGPDPRGFLTALRLEGNQYRRLETMFKFTNVTSRLQCPRGCYTFASASTGHTLSIQGNPHHNLKKLHIRAQRQRSRLDRNGPCTKIAGPYQQRLGNFTDYPIYILGNGRNECQECSFNNQTCRIGRLKVSYPVGAVA